MAVMSDVLLLLLLLSVKSRSRCGRRIRQTETGRNGGRRMVMRMVVVQVIDVMMILLLLLLLVLVLLLLLLQLHETFDGEGVVHRWIDLGSHGSASVTGLVVKHLSADSSGSVVFDPVINGRRLHHDVPVFRVVVVVIHRHGNHSFPRAAIFHFFRLVVRFAFQFPANQFRRHGNNGTAAGGLLGSSLLGRLSRCVQLGVDHAGNGIVRIGRRRRMMVMQAQIGGHVHQQRLRLHALHHLLVLLLLLLLLLVPVLLVVIQLLLLVHLVLLLLLLQLLLLLAGRGRRRRRRRQSDGRLTWNVFLPEDVLLLETTSPPQVGSVVEHVVRVGIERPIGSLARLLVVPRHLDETFVERQIMADRVLPALLVLPVVGEAIHDELVDPVQRDLLLRSRALDGHGDQGDVRIRRFHHVLDADDARVVRHDRRGSARSRCVADVSRRRACRVRIVTAHGRRVIITGVSVNTCDITGRIGTCGAGRSRQRRRLARRRLVRRRSSPVGSASGTVPAGLDSDGDDGGSGGRGCSRRRRVMVPIIGVVMMMALMVIEKRMVMLHVGRRRIGRGRRSRAGAH